MWSNKTCLFTDVFSLEIPTFNIQGLCVFRLHNAGCNCCCCRTDSRLTIRIVDTLFSEYNKRTETCTGKGSRRNNTLYTTYSLNSSCLSSSHQVLIRQHDQVSPEPGSRESLGEVFTDRSGAAHQTITDMRWFTKPFLCDTFGAGQFRSQNSPVSQTLWAVSEVLLSSQFYLCNPKSHICNLMTRVHVTSHSLKRRTSCCLILTKVTKTSCIRIKHDKTWVCDDLRCERVAVNTPLLT